MNLLRLPRERLLMAGAAAGLLLLGLDRLAFTPFLNAWRNRADEIRRLRTDVEQGAALMDQETRWLRWRDDLAARLLPAAPGEAESRVLSQMDGWARAAGLALHSLRPRWTEGPDRAPRLEFQVAGSGSLQSVTAFLYQVETSPIAIAVEQLELVPRNPEGTEVSLDLRVSGLCETAPGKAEALP